MTTIDSLIIILAFSASIGSGMVAGIFFAFSSFVMTATALMAAILLTIGLCC